MRSAAVTTTNCVLARALLTAISGHCDLLLLRKDASHPDFSDLTQIRQNSNRAAPLVRQLLAFSRKQTLQPKLLSVQDVAQNCPK